MKNFKKIGLIALIVGVVGFELVVLTTTVQAETPYSWIAAKYNQKHHLSSQRARGVKQYQGLREKGLR